MKLQYLKALHSFLSGGVWEVNRHAAPAHVYVVARTLQWIYAVVREFTEGDLTFRAMSLVYTTLLSLVPLLAVSFSMLKAFGVHNQIEPLFSQTLEPLGTMGMEIGANVIGFVENLKVGVLGSVGLLVLLYTVVSMLEKIEDAFNHIWRVDRSRNKLRRFSDYLSVILVGPVLIFSAVGLTASMTSGAFVQEIISMEPFGTVYYVVGVVVPYLFFIGAFTLLYIFITNARVRVLPALAGGVVAGLSWKAVGWLFAIFVVNSANYNAVYSGFAIVIIFMIWIYVNWLIVLLGGQIAFYYQYPQYIRFKDRVPRLSNRLREKVGLLLVYLIGSRFCHGERPWSLDDLCERLVLPREPVLEIIRILEKKRFILALDSDRQRYTLARDLAAIPLSELLLSLRRADEEAFFLESPALSVPIVDRLTTELGNACEAVWGRMTLHDLVVSENTTVSSVPSNTPATAQTRPCSPERGRGASDG